MSGSNLAVIQLEDCIKFSPRVDDQKMQNKGWLNCGDPQFIVAKWSTSSHTDESYHPNEKLGFIFKDYSRAPYNGHPIIDNRYILGIIDSSFNLSEIIYQPFSKLDLDDEEASKIGDVKDIGWGPYIDGKQLLIVLGDLSLLLFVIEDKKPILFKKMIPINLQHASSIAVKFNAENDVLLVAVGLANGEAHLINLTLSKCLNVDVIGDTKLLTSMDNRSCQAITFNNSYVSILKGSMVVVVNVDTLEIMKFVAHDGLATQLLWVDKEHLATVGTDEAFRVWKLSNSSILLVHSNEIKLGAIWGFSLSPNVSYITLLSRVEGQHKMYHLKQASSLFSVLSIEFNSLHHIIIKLLDKIPFYWDIIPIIRQLTKEEREYVIATIKVLSEERHEALKILYIVYQLVR